MQNLKKVVKQINQLESTMQKYSNEELKDKTKQWKNEISEGKKLEEILPFAFAVVREAIKRVTKKRLYDVQLLRRNYH